MADMLYICRHCGNIIGKIEDSGVPVYCCGEEMSPLKASNKDQGAEKHVPQIKVEGTTVTVTVGSVPHPMEVNHHISWILLQTKQGRQRKLLASGQAPVAVFAITADDEVVNAFAYCNLHGLWANK